MLEEGMNVLFLRLKKLTAPEAGGKNFWLRQNRLVRKLTAIERAGEGKFGCAGRVKTRKIKNFKISGIFV